MPAEADILSNKIIHLRLSAKEICYEGSMLIFVVALAVRLLAFWFLPEPHLPYNAVYAYLSGAKLLLEGEGFLDASFPVYTPPLYSLSIALAASLFGGDGIVGIKVIQIVLDSLTAVIIYVLVRNLFDRVTGYVSAMIWALYPFAIYPTLYIGTETLFTFFVALWALLTTRALKESRWEFYCGSGAVLALATLTRGTTQFLPLLLPFVVLAIRGSASRWFRECVIMLSCFIVVILPWGLRNYLVLNEIIPVGINNTIVLWGSSESLWTIDTRTTEYPLLVEAATQKGIISTSKDMGIVERDRNNVKLAMENYRNRLMEDPSSIVPFMAKKFLRLWYSTESGNNHGISLFINGLIYLPACIGIVAGWRRNKGAALALCGLIGYFALIHWVTLPLFRYMIPVMPYVIVFSAIGLLFVLECSCPRIYRRLQSFGTL